MTERKRGPGRPPKKPAKSPAPKYGIVDTPSTPNHFLEFYYEFPLNFKKILHFFKQMAVEKIQIIFGEKEVIIWAEDHHKKSKIRIRIKGNKLNHYYIKSELVINVSSRDLELIMNKIDKNYTGIMFVSNNGYTQKQIKVILTNDMKVEERAVVELINDTTKHSDKKFLDDDYTIKFTLPGKFFKKIISDIKNFSPHVAFKQDDINEPLILEYITSDKKVKGQHIFRDKKKIDFSSQLKRNHTFRASCKLDDIKPISQSLLSENITVCAHEQKDILTIINVDDAIDIRVLTKLSNQN